MGLAEPSPLNDNVDESHDGDQRVFVRVISVRPGAPWDQSRQAALEARLGAPARLSDVAYRVRRLESWRPSRPARFAAVYARAEDTRNGFRATPTIDGRRLAVSFTPPAVQARRFRDLGLAGAAVGVAMGLVLFLGLTVASRRSQATQLLDQTEAIASAKLLQAERLDQIRSDGRLLDQLRLRDQRLSQVLAEIAWASKARSPSAHIQALHWDHGFLALEADGDTVPIQSREVSMQRSRAPVRPGVWLWGLPSTEPWAAGLGEVAGPKPDSERDR